VRCGTTGLAGDALGDDFGVFVDVDGHGVGLLLTATIFMAASAAVSLADDRQAESASIFFPGLRWCSSCAPRLAPDRFTALQAVTPSAIVSHFMMPPDVVKIPRLRVLSMILKLP
jgi:hypothetical protein